MFPFNSNDPYIDSNGKRSTLGDAIGSGGGGDDPYVLPTATSERLGGVKIGSGIDVSEDGTISVSGGGGGGGTELKYFEIEQNCNVSQNTWTLNFFSNSAELAGKTIVGATLINSPSNGNFTIAMGQISANNIAMWVYSIATSSPAKLKIRFHYYDTPTT